MSNITSSRVLEPSSTIDPLSTQALFWRAKYVKSSEFLPHLPFLFWLTSVLRPALVVQIGLGQGVSYFGICQAVDRLRLLTCCQGIVPAPFTLSEGEYAELRSYNAQQYEDFSEISIQDPRAAVADHAPGSVDLLVIDLTLPAQQQEELIKLWHPKLSDRAVVLLRGTRNITAAEMARLRHLAQGRPAISFTRGSGLLAILYGAHQDPDLESLASPVQDHARQTTLLRMFYRLGETHELHWAKQETERHGLLQRRQLEETRRDLERLRNENILHRQERDEQGRKLAELSQSLLRLAELKEKFFDLENCHSILSSELSKERIAGQQAQARLVEEIEQRHVAETSLSRLEIIHQMSLAELTHRCAQLTDELLIFKTKISET